MNSIFELNLESMTERLLNLILLKSSADEARDKYIDYIQRNNAILKIFSQIKLINCLQFEFINNDVLKTRLDTMFTTDAYTTLVLTSSQAIEAIRALEEISYMASDSLIDVYCVGEETKAAFQALIESKLTYLKPRIGQIITPSQFNRRQNSLELANLILNHYKNTRFCAFFPCSSIRKPDLVDALQDAGLKVDELFVYNTCKSAEGLVELKTFLFDLNTVSSPCLNLIALFSPSCVDAFFYLYSNDQHAIARLSLCFISIGPSTARRFADCCQSNDNFQNFQNIELDEPSPVDLWKKSLNLSENLKF